jgi:hypothetical protein
MQSLPAQVQWRWGELRTFMKARPEALRSALNLKLLNPVQSRLALRVPY